MKKAGFAFTLFTACMVSAAVTIAILSYAAKTARLRVASQYTSPDYVRFISEGYAFDTVSTKRNVLLTVTDGELPVRIHIFTIDEDKNTLDILELPPDSYVIADGFSGTLRDAFKTTVYSEIISHVLCLRIDGSASFDAKTLGDGAQLLGVTMSYPDGVSSSKLDRNEISVDSATGEKIALDGYSYSGGDSDAVKMYRSLLAAILNNLCERGSLDSFSVLMNLIVNRVNTNMTIEEIIEIANSAKDIKPKKINIYIAAGSPAKFGEDRVWSLNPESVAELLNEHFRVKGIEYPAESLSIPAVTAGEFPYEDLPVRVQDIINRQ